MHAAESDDQALEEDEKEEEQATATLIDHPVVVLLERGAGDIGPDGLRSVGVGALETLEAATLGLVALEVGGLGAVDDDVGVLLEGGNLAVGEVHSGLPLEGIGEGHGGSAG